MDNTMQIANSWPVWVFASLIIGVVVFQGIKFLQIARKAGAGIGLSNQEMNKAIKTGAITAIGPSFGIVIVAISLISLLGNPLTMMRIGVIGSAPIESLGASLSAESAGASLTGTTFTPEVFTLIVWTLCIGGSGWMLFTLFFNKSLGTVQEKISATPNGKKYLSVIALIAMIAIFGSLTSAEMIKGLVPALTAVAAILSSLLMNLIAEKKKIIWLKEWALGLSIIIALTVTYFII